MRPVRTLLACALLALTRAQTPGNFSVVSSAPLNLIAQPGNVNIFPGVLLQQSDVLDPPTISLPAGLSSSAIYTVFMIDPTTSNGNFLHWWQPNYVVASNGSFVVDTTVRNASTAVGAEYVYPQPPNDGYAHQYVILLYSQPLDWAVPDNYSTYNPPASNRDRIGFNMASFQQAAGLSAPVGTSFFMVQNTTTPQPKTSSSSTASRTASSGSASASATSGSATTSASATASASGNAAVANVMSDLASAGCAGLFAIALLL